MSEAGTTADGRPRLKRPKQRASTITSQAAAAEDSSGPSKSGSPSASASASPAALAALAALTSGDSASSDGASSDSVSSDGASSDGASSMVAAGAVSSSMWHKSAALLSRPEAFTDPLHDQVAKASDRPYF